MRARTEGWQQPLQATANVAGILGGMVGRRRQSSFNFHLLLASFRCSAAQQWCWDNCGVQSDWCCTVFGPSSDGGPGEEVALPPFHFCCPAWRRLIRAFFEIPCSLAVCQSAQKTTWQRRVNTASRLINQIATRRSSLRSTGATWMSPTGCRPCGSETINLHIVKSVVVVEIRAHHDMHSFRVAKELQDGGDHPSPKSSVRLFPRSQPLTVFLFLLPADRSGQTCGFGHRKLWILRRMKDVFSGGGKTPPLPPPLQPLFTRSHPLATPRMTPDPSACLHQAAKVRNSDESLRLRVYTPESRKEGNQPRSAKSGEVRENSCSPPGPQWFSSRCLHLFHVISAAEDGRPVGRRRWRAGAGSTRWRWTPAQNNCFIRDPVSSSMKKLRGRHRLLSLTDQVVPSRWLFLR